MDIKFDAGMQLTVHPDFTLTKDGTFGPKPETLRFDVATGIIEVVGRGNFRLAYQAASGVEFLDPPVTFKGSPTNVRLGKSSATDFQINVIVTSSARRHAVEYTVQTTRGPIDPSIAIEPPGDVADSHDPAKRVRDEAA